MNAFIQSLYFIVVMTSGAFHIQGVDYGTTAACERVADTSCYDDATQVRGCEEVRELVKDGAEPHLYQIREVSQGNVCDNECLYKSEVKEVDCSSVETPKDKPEETLHPEVPDDEEPMDEDHS